MIRMTNVRRPLRAALIAALVLGTMPAVQAANLPTERIYVGDLELQNPRGQRELQRRVDIAIDRVCRPVGSALLPSPRTRRLTRECRANAWTQVQGQLDRRGVPLPIAARPTVSAQRN